MIELGNPSQAIPYYAIYGPNSSKPITLEALITHGMVQNAVEQVSDDTTIDTASSGVTPPIVVSTQ